MECGEFFRRRPVATPLRRKKKCAHIRLEEDWFWCVVLWLMRYTEIKVSKTTRPGGFTMSEASSRRMKCGQGSAGRPECREEAGGMKIDFDLIPDHVRDDLAAATFEAVREYLLAKARGS